MKTNLFIRCYKPESTNFLLLESTSDSAKLNDRLMIILDGPDSPDHESAIDTLYDKKRTNVTFNELVERIEVIDETPIKPQDYEEEDMNVRL